MTTPDELNKLRNIAEQAEVEYKNYNQSFEEDWGVFHQQLIDAIQAQPDISPEDLQKQFSTGALNPLALQNARQRIANAKNNADETQNKATAATMTGWRALVDYFINFIKFLGVPVKTYQEVANQLNAEAQSAKKQETLLVKCYQARIKYIFSQFIFNRDKANNQKTKQAPLVESLATHYTAEVLASPRTEPENQDRLDIPFSVDPTTIAGIDPGTFDRVTLHTPDDSTNSFSIPHLVQPQEQAQLDIDAEQSETLEQMPELTSLAEEEKPKLFLHDQIKQRRRIMGLDVDENEADEHTTSQDLTPEETPTQGYVEKQPPKTIHLSDRIVSDMLARAAKNTKKPSTQQSESEDEAGWDEKPEKEIFSTYTTIQKLSGRSPGHVSQTSEQKDKATAIQKSTLTEKEKQQIKAQILWTHLESKDCQLIRLEHFDIRSASSTLLQNAEYAIILEDDVLSYVSKGFGGKLSIKKMEATEQTLQSFNQLKSTLESFAVGSSRKASPEELLIIVSAVTGWQRPTEVIEREKIEGGSRENQQAGTTAVTASLQDNNRLKSLLMICKGKFGSEQTFTDKTTEEIARVFRNAIDETKISKDSFSGNLNEIAPNILQFYSRIRKYHQDDPHLREFYNILTKSIKDDHLPPQETFVAVVSTQPSESIVSTPIPDEIPQKPKGRAFLGEITQRHRDGQASPNSVARSISPNPEPTPMSKDLLTSIKKFKRSEPGSQETPTDSPTVKR